METSRSSPKRIPRIIRSWPPTMSCAACRRAGAELLYCDDGLASQASWDEAFRYNGYTIYDTYQTQAPSSGWRTACRAGGPSRYRSVPRHRLDSDGVPSGTLTNGGVDIGDKTDDTELLHAWLSDAGHEAYLWVLGSRVANDLKNTDRSWAGTWGLLLSTGIYYNEATGLRVPKVIDLLLAWKTATSGLTGAARAERASR